VHFHSLINVAITNRLLCILNNCSLPLIIIQKKKKKRKSGGTRKVNENLRGSDTVAHVMNG
jgi:hypothetical protein